MEVKEKHIEELLIKAMQICKQEGYKGKYFSKGNYYIQFSFEEIKKKCKECGHELA